ncbi:MAG: TIR domain-containing protein [Blastocatellia bacterium]
MAKSDKPGVFISYSQHDEPMMRQLVAHLSMLEADLWHDRKLVAGDRWEETLDERLDSAEIILLLISRHFFESDFCKTVELPRALERGRKSETRVIPILISSYLWERTAVSEFQVLPANRKPIEIWERSNEACTHIADEIGKIIDSIRPKSESHEHPKWQLPKHKLPYLCDRSDQEEELGKQLRQHLKAKNSRPVICLVHGDVREAHSEFLDRLKSIWLPDFLKTDSGVKKHVIETPGNASSQAFWGKIGKVLAQDYPDTQEDVWPYIARHAEPLMLILNLRSSEVGGTLRRVDQIITELLQ